MNIESQLSIKFSYEQTWSRNRCVLLSIIQPFQSFSYTFLVVLVCMHIYTVRHIEFDTQTIFSLKFLYEKKDHKKNYLWLNSVKFSFFSGSKNKIIKWNNFFFLFHFCHHRSTKFHKNSPGLHRRSSKVVTRSKFQSKV